MPITYSAGVITITGFTKEDPCTFNDIYLADQAGGWGVVYKIILPGYEEYSEYFLSYYIDARIVVGTAFPPPGVAGWLADEEINVEFSFNVVSPLITANKGGLRLGVLLDAEKKITVNGVSIISNTDAADMIQCGTAEIELYSSRFSTSTLATNNQLKFSGAFKLYNCILDGVYITTNSASAIPDVYRVSLANASFFASLAGSLGTFEDLSIHSIYYGVFAYSGFGAAMRNSVVKNNTYLAYFSGFTANFNFINFEVENWAFYWFGVCSGKANRQYEFDAHCQDKNGNDISGVLAVGEYINPYGQAFSATTDGNGDISTQTSDHGFFDQGHGNTEQLKTPLKVTYSKAGYQTVVKYYDLDQKTKDVVVMHKAVSIFLDLGRPAVNLNKSDPENKNVMIL